MKRLWTPILLAIAASCGEPDYEHQSVEIGRIIDDPYTYIGRRVQTEGYYRLTVSGGFLYRDEGFRDDWQASHILVLTHGTYDPENGVVWEKMLRARDGDFRGIHRLNCEDGYMSISGMLGADEHYAVFDDYGLLIAIDSAECASPP